MRDPDSESPRSETASSSRERLLLVAATLFHEDGYHHVSLDRILREAGVVRSNFYYHFRSKEDLAVTVMDSWLEDLTERIVRPALETTAAGPLGRVRLVLLGLVDELEESDCRGGCPFGSLANAEAAHNDRFRRKLIETFDGFAQLFDDLFSDAIAAGTLPATLAAPRLAACALAVVQGGYVLAKTYSGVTPMRLAAEGFLDVLAAAAARSLDSAV